MPFLRISFVLVITIILSSCMANQKIVNLNDLERRRISKVKLYKESNSLPESNYRVIKQIKGLSCWRNTLNPKIVTEGEALDGLRIRAAQLDADAVVNIYCEHRTETDWKNNCWESFSCYGDAVEFTAKGSMDVADALIVETGRYSLDLGEGLDSQTTEPIISYGNDYPEDTYDLLGVVDVIHCEDKDFFNMRWSSGFMLPSIPLPPPDSEDMVGLDYLETIKKRSVIESLKTSAKEAGADAVVNLICQPSTGPTVKLGCKSYIQCIGDLISFK
jgi:uncharacterized protein YbjQ (UPF0145 family)